MLSRHSLITSVDIGATTTTAVIAEADNHGYVELLGHGQSPTMGFGDDNVNDIRELGGSISASVDAAEEMAGLHDEPFPFVHDGRPVRAILIVRVRGAAFQLHRRRHQDKASFVYRRRLDRRGR